MLKTKKVVELFYARYYFAHWINSMNYKLLLVLFNNTLWQLKIDKFYERIMVNSKLVIYFKCRKATVKLQIYNCESVRANITKLGGCIILNIGNWFLKKKASEYINLCTWTTLSTSHLRLYILLSFENMHQRR